MVQVTSIDKQNVNLFFFVFTPSWVVSLSSILDNILTKTNKSENILERVSVSQRRQNLNKCRPRKCKKVYVKKAKVQVKKY